MITTSHLGLCVSDLDRSLRFYCEGLGFEVSDRHEIGDLFAAPLEVSPPVILVSQFIRRPDLAIELLGWSSPQPSGVPQTSRGQMGLTHLSFWVDELDPLIETLVALGGTLLPETRLTMGPLDLVFLADPDGTRVELMKRMASD